VHHIPSAQHLQIRRTPRASLHHDRELPTHGSYTDAHSVAHGLHLMHTKVTLGIKNNLKTGDGRIGYRQFWAPPLPAAA